MSYLRVGPYASTAYHASIAHHVNCIIHMLRTHVRHIHALHAWSAHTCSTRMFDTYILHMHVRHIHASHACSTYTCFTRMFDIYMLTSIASYVCSHQSHHMYARIDHITCIDRITCMLVSITSHVSHESITLSFVQITLRGSKTHCTQRTAFHVLNVLGYANHAVLHPVWTQEVKKVRPYLPTHSRTSDTTLRAPTATHMLHIHGQQLLIRHSHYRPHSSIGK